MNKSDPENYVDCGEYACWTMLQIYRYNFYSIIVESNHIKTLELTLHSIYKYHILMFSLVSDPQAYEQPDLDGDGARDLDPIGKLGIERLSLRGFLTVFYSN